MKIIKHLFPRLTGSLRSCPKQSPPLRKKALLVGIRKIRQDSAEIPQENGERPPEDDVHIAPRRKKKKMKARKERDEEGTRELKGPHRDVLDMKQLLIDVYHYDPKDITVLIDDDHPDHMQPTRENMIQMMIELIEGALAGDQFFFHFSGHATQEDTESPEEEDRKDELVISSDGKTIKDDLLRKLLVDPLPIESTLVAIFDSCHSCSLLDLRHFRCNRVYVPWLNKGRRKTDFHRNIQMRHNAYVSLRSVTQAKRLSQHAITWKRTSIDQVLSSPVSSHPGTFASDRAHIQPIRTKSKKSLSITTENLEGEAWYGSTMSPINRCGSPEAMYCTGNCSFDEGEPSADVISLSSSKDSQRSWEDPQGSSMTQALIKVLKDDPNPSLKHLLTLISHDMHVFYVSMHCKARRYKKEVKDYNDSRQQEGKEVKKPKSVEMDNFQNPQIASSQPLDMNRRWHL